MSTLDFVQADFRLAPLLRGRLAWIETLALGALAIGLGYWLAPADPLLVHASFPWGLLVPLLLGMRYGFTHGLAGSALLVLALFGYRMFGAGLYAELPVAFIAGVLICGMLAGEFRDIWERRLHRLQLANDYRQQRLDEFTRAHHILRISHDRLEQRIAGSDQSLRSSLLGLRSQLSTVPREQDALQALAEPILNLLGQYGSLRIAGLYRIRNGHLQPQPLSVLGTMPDLAPDDLLVRLCLERGELISLREELLERGEHRRHSDLQVCLPLIDTRGRILALLAVAQMPFFALNERTLSLLAILGGHIADLLQSDPQALQLRDADAQLFTEHLKRALLDARKHGLPATLYAFEAVDPQRSEELQRLLEESRRGLDLLLKLVNVRGHPCLLVLLPLTSALGAEGYLERFLTLLAERYGKDCDPKRLGIRIMHYELKVGNEREPLRQFLYNECGLDDRYIAL